MSNERLQLLFREREILIIESSFGSF